MQNRALSPFISSIFCLLFVVLASTARAAEPAAEPSASAEASEYQRAMAAASKAVRIGPAEVALAHQAVFQVPAGFGFIPSAEAGQLLTAMGNRVGTGLEGLVVPAQPGENDNWFVVIRYQDAGYIKDDDARDWDAEQLLADIRAGTEESNEDRRQRGIPEIEVAGWVERPAYDAAYHRLVWSLASHQKGETGAEGNGVNYNTLALGRNGYFSLNMVTAMDRIEALKPVAQTLLAALDFESGKRYADFNADTDKVAEYGLAALVAGVAAKKIGLFAVAAAFAAKFAKIIFITALVAMGGLRNLFRGKSKKDSNLQA